MTLNWVAEGTGTLGKIDLNLGLLPKKSIIIIEVFQMLFLLRLFFFLKKNFYLQIALLIAFVFISFEFLVHVFVGNSLTIWVSGIRYYLSFFPLFLLGYLLGKSGYTINREFKWLLAILFLQVPVSIWQFFVAQIKILGTGQLYFDAIAGTMGGFVPNLMSVVLCFGIIFFLIKYIDDRKLRYAFCALILVVPSIISESKGMYIILLLISIYLVRISKLNASRVFSLVLISATLILGFIFAYNSLDFGLSQAKGFELSSLLDYLKSESGGGRLSRIESILHAFKVIFENQSPIFGMGIGSANSNPLGVNPRYNDFFTIRHSVDTVIVETGILGLIILVYLLVKMYLISRKVIRRLPKSDTFNIQIAKLIGGMVAVLSVGLFWEDVLFRVQLMYPFGLLCGYIIGLNKRFSKSIIK